MFKYDDSKDNLLEACGVTDEDIPAWLEGITTESMELLRDKLAKGSQEDAEWAAFAICVDISIEGKPFMVVPLTGFKFSRPVELIRELANTRNLELFDILASGFNTALKHVPAQQ